jgi:hypothetical protein
MKWEGYPFSGISPSFVLTQTLKKKLGESFVITSTKVQEWFLIIVFLSRVMLKTTFLSYKYSIIKKNKKKNKKKFKGLVETVMSVL